MKIKELILISSLFLLALTAKANHILGGNITWECLGGNQYAVTFTMYKDCYGSPGSPPNENLFFFPSGCGAASFSTDLLFVSETEISELCATELIGSSCSGGLAPGTMQVVFSGIVTLDPGCTWKVIWNNGDWNYFQNLDPFCCGSPLDAFITSTIDTSTGCANSIDITSNAADPQVRYVCNTLANFSHPIAVTNPTGYTLTYTLTDVLTTGASLPNSITAPSYSLSGLAGITISSTGVINFNVTPGQLGNYIVSVCIQMYDGVDYVGTVYENLVFVFRNCAPTVTSFNLPQVQSIAGGTVQVDNNTVEICAGDTLIFNVQASNPDLFKVIDLSITNYGGLPVGDNTGNPTTHLDIIQGPLSLNPAIGTVQLLTTAAMIGTHNVTIHAVDNQCPNPDTDDIVVEIIIKPNLYTPTLDTLVCKNQLVAISPSGGTTYNWTVVSGDNTPATFTNNLNQGFDQTTVLQVVAAGAPTYCNYRDTVTVHVSLTDLTASVTNATCGGSNGAIDLTVLGDGSGNYGYNWTGVGALDGQQDQTGLASGPYSVIVTDLNIAGCTASENPINVTSTPLPAGTILVSNDTICELASTNIFFDFTAGTGPFDVTLEDPLGNPVTVNSGNPINDGATVNVSPGVGSNTYTLTEITDANNCTVTVNSIVIIVVRPFVEANFLPAGPFCDNDNVTLTVDFPGNEAGTYNVTYTSTPSGFSGSAVVSDGGTIMVGAPTQNTTWDIDQVTYTNAPTCASLDANNGQVAIIVNNPPSATLSGGGGICGIGSLNLSIALTGTGPWEVSYTGNGGGIINPINVSPYVWNVSPAASANYCITEVTDITTGCSSSPVAECENVVVTSVPSVTFTLSDTEICDDEEGTIIVECNTPLAQPLTLVFSESNVAGTLPSVFTNQFCPFSYNYGPDVTTTITLDSIYVDGAPQCAALPNTSLTINVFSDIAVTPIDTICDGASENYQVQYSLTGDNGIYANPTTLVAGGSYGTGANSDIYTSGSIVSGGSGSWTFTGAHACNTVVSQVTNYACPVITDAGTMVLTPIVICGTGTAAATWNNDGALDTNDQQMFILHTTPLASQGTVLATSPNVASFNFNAPMVYGTTYYISSVAGNDAGDGTSVNLNAPNVQISPGTPVTWYPTPTATLSAPAGLTACEGSCVTLNIDFTGIAPWTIILDRPGALADTTITTSNDPYTICVNQTGTYQLSSVTGSSQNCTGTFSGSATATIYPKPTAVFASGGATCSGTNFCFDINLTGTADWAITIDGPVGPNIQIPVINATPYSTFCSDDAGSYQIVSVTDAHCTNTTPSPAVSLTVYALPTVQWSVNDTSFCQGSSITIGATILGTAAPYVVDYSAPAGELPSPWDGSAQSINTAGTYTINYVTDNHNCQSLAGDEIEVEQINTPIANAGPDLETCSGAPINIGSGSIAGQTYTWNITTGMLPGDATTSDPTIDYTTAATVNLNYIVTAHAQQCTATDNMQLTVYALPNANIIASDDSICFNSSVTLTASGGSSYQWQASPSIVGATNVAAITAEPSANEVFYVTVFQTNGNIQCENSDSLEVIVGTELLVNEEFTAEICFGTCTGEIGLNPAGGFPTYELDPNSDVQALDNVDLCPGTYDYIVLDQQGCSASGTIIIEEREPEYIDEIIITPPTCVYDFGTIDINDNSNSVNINGCGNNITKTDGLFVFTNLTPCEYTFTTIYEVAPNEFCTTDTIVSLESISPEVTIEPVWTEDVFCYLSDACFEVIAGGGTGGLDVIWYNCAESFNPLCYVSTQNPFCMALESDSTLWVHVSDQLGCNSDTVSVNALLAPEITLNVQNGDDSTFVCLYSCAELVAQSGGGNGATSIEWYVMPNDIVPFSLEDTVVQCPSDTLTYFAIASDGCSQPVVDSLYVIVWETPIVTILADTLEGCYPLTVNFTYEIDNPDLASTCVWDFDNGFTQAICADVSYTYPYFDEYYPSFSAITSRGCVGTDTLDVPITVHGYPEIDFTWEPQPVTVLDSVVTFSNLTENAITYNWDFAGLGQSQEFNPTVAFPDVDLAIYQVCLEATSFYGCVDTVCKDIFMESILEVFVPNAFTPDGDDINDVFVPVVDGVAEDNYKFTIVDRWGSEIFVTDEIGKPWTGGVNGGGYYVQNDVYIWRLEVESLHDGSIQVFKGFVTLIR
jgi:gliding motility-associated-like protein